MILRKVDKVQLNIIKTAKAWGFQSVETEVSGKCIILSITIPKTVKYIYIM